MKGGLFQCELGFIRFIQRRAMSERSESCWGKSTKHGVK
jgi:hypothetical protein